MGKLPVHLIVQGVLVVTVGAASAFVGAILAGAVGGVAIAVAPEAAFGLVGESLCPQGSLEFSSVQRSYHEPGESEPSLACVTPSGESLDVLLQGILLVLGLSFVVIGGATFILVYLPLAIIAFLITGYFLARAGGGRTS